jgi:hypothetical protein
MQQTESSTKGFLPELQPGQTTYGNYELGKRRKGLPSLRVVGRRCIERRLGYGTAAGDVPLEL